MRRLEERSISQSIKKHMQVGDEIVKPLTAFTPEGMFPGYPRPKGAISIPQKRANLLGEAGYPVVQNSDGTFSCPISGGPGRVYLQQPGSKQVRRRMDAGAVETESRRHCWPAKYGVEDFLEAKEQLDYKGFARGAWGADYMDPFTFLSLFYTGGESGTGWQDPEYVEMLDEANRTLDPKQRYALLAKAEAYLIEAQPIIPIDSPSVNWMKKPYVKGMYPNPGLIVPVEIRLYRTRPGQVGLWHTEFGRRMRSPIADCQFP